MPRRRAHSGAFASLCRTAFFALLSTGLFTVSAKAQIPRGVFSLTGAGAKARAAVLANPDVVGISVRQDWADLEPTDGQFDWSYLDSELARVAGAGKVRRLA